MQVTPQGNNIRTSKLCYVEQLKIINKVYQEVFKCERVWITSYAHRRAICMDNEQEIISQLS